ncbi:MAG TPA: hypothetical protein PKY31_13280 [Spirochaetota bacterium]|nr:hypothetical protein [Spirochaetota bacterium]
MIRIGRNGALGLLAGAIVAVGALVVRAVRLYTSTCVAGDCENGDGTMKYDDGTTYIGRWKDGKRSGEGTLYYPDGRKFVGNWSDDFMHGDGVIYYSNGLVERQGRWENGHFTGDITG